MIYVYCSECKAIHEAQMVKKRSFLGKETEYMACAKCRKEVKGQLIEKNCEVCGNVLYVPQEQKGLELPCKAEHETARLAAVMEARKKEQEDKINFSMREVPCQHCPDVVLRVKNGRYPCCPNCGNEPSEEYLQKKWLDLTNQKPGLIRWTDPEGKTLIHVDQRVKDIPPYSLLIVAPGYYVQYSSHGADWRTLANGTYALFKDTQTEEERIMLVNENENLQLGLATRILFFHEEICRISCRISVRICDRRWQVTVPVTAHLQISKENVGRFMRHGWNLTDDQKLTEQVKSIVQKAVAKQIEQHILERVFEDDSVKTFEDENAVRVWFNDNFTFGERAKITAKMQEELRSTYGITMPDPITYERVEIIDLYNTKEVECINCNQINHVPADAYVHHKDFTCESCGATVLWCPTCRRYVTNRRRSPSRGCDICDHMIW